MARIRLLLSATCVALMLTVQVAAENATVETACFKGQPKVELFDDITVIENEGYVVGFLAETRTPIWACYRFDGSGATHDLSRPKGKKFDTYSDGQIVVRHKDYSNSGYDRGHMAPSAGIGKYYGEDAQLGTFKTTNICPQHPGLNQRCWERFEKQVADWYAKKLGEVWVVTGPIFQEPCVELESDIRVPQAFYKIVVAEIDGKVEMLGIIMPNERTEKSPIAEYIHMVDDIEALTAIDFFCELDDGVEGTAEAKGTIQNPVNPAWSPGWELRSVFSGAERTFRIRECD